MTFCFRLANRLAMLIVLASLASCNYAQPSYGNDPRALNAGDVQMLNYTPWYIHTAEIAGPEGSGVSGGGPNVMPAESGTHPSGGGGGTCCLSYPAVWQPDLKVTVRWLVDKKQDGKTSGSWYKAENVRIAKYDGKKTGGAWLIFLPDDRVRLMVVDGSEGGNDPDVRPPDEGPLIVKGVVDKEWNDQFPGGVARRFR